MPDPARRTTRTIATTIRFLARFGLAGTHVGGLTNAQRAALRYFARFNRLSRTVTGFARYHSTTRGSASQTIDGLVKRGLLVCIRDLNDRRRFHFDLTDTARDLISCEADDHLCRAISSLSRDRRADLESLLEELSARIVEDADSIMPGTCTRCRFAVEQSGRMEAHAEHFCKNLHAELDGQEAAAECIHFSSGGLGDGRAACP